MSQAKRRIVILISGRGSNLNALMHYTRRADCAYEIAAVVSNRPQAPGLELAQRQGLAITVIDHTLFATRESFDAALSERIETYRPDLIVLAGFMRILSAGFTLRYLGKLLNIHPSLLPLYPGLKTHQRVLAAGDKQHGATVHCVTPTLDGGPPIIQSRFAVDAHDTPSTLADKVLITEHIIYPLAVQWFAQNKLTMIENRISINTEGEEFLSAPVLYANNQFTGPDLLCGNLPADTL